MYDASIARWNGVDALAEKYKSLSSYNYVAGNPINSIDPNGKEIKVIRKKKNLFRKKDVIKIKVKGVLINNSSKKLTRKDLKIARDRMKNGIRRAYSGNGANIKWKGKAKIRVARKGEKSLKKKDHAFRLYDDGKIPHTDKSGKFFAKGTLGAAPPGERLVMLNVNALSPTIGGNWAVQLERTVAHEVGHSGNMHQINGVFVGHPGATLRPKNLMHQSWNPNAGWLLDEDQVLQMENDYDNVLNGGRQIIN